MKVFLDKNILFHYLRKILFNEQVPLSSLQIIRCIHKKKITAAISENALFGLINYCIYKLERDFEYDPKECEKRAKEKIKFLLKGDWEIKSLEIRDFENALEENKVPFLYNIIYKSNIVPSFPTLITLVTPTISSIPSASWT